MKLSLTIIMLISVVLLHAQNRELQKEILLETDRQLSKRSTEIGTLEAFVHFIADEAILIPAFGHPIHGKNSYKRIISETNNKSDFNIPGWKPIFAQISTSGEFAYTFGRYKIKKEKSDYQNSKYNYYGSVWKKQEDGNWKIEIHTGLILLDSINFITEKSNGAKFAKEAEKFIQADENFSKLSVQKGYLQAFHAFIDENGIVISSQGREPANKERYRKLIEQNKKNKPATVITLSWKPLYADISASAELGYTHGYAKWVSKDAKGKSSTGFSYYLTIWEKQKDGSWRFVFDGGNKSSERKK